MEYRRVFATQKSGFPSPLNIFLTLLKYKLYMIKCTYFKFMISWALTNVYTQVTFTTTSDSEPFHHFNDSLVYMHLNQSPIPISGISNHWSTFYHFRLNLSFLEFHIRKWPLSLTIKFLFSLKANLDIPVKPSLTFSDCLFCSALSIHYCIMLH